MAIWYDDDGQPYVVQERNAMPLPGPRHQIEATVMHCFEPPSHDKVYVLWIENRGGDEPYFVCGGYGKRTISGMLKVDPRGTFGTLAGARSWVDAIRQDKEKKGYEDVESTPYLGRLSGPHSPHRVRFEQFINPQKVDTSRIIGYSVGAEVVAAPTPVATPRQVASGSVKKQRPGHVDQGRSRRSIDL